MWGNRHEIKYIRKGIAFFIVLMFLFVGVWSGNSTACAKEEIYNQCGMTYSGKVGGEPLSNQVYMKGYDDWPEGFERIKTVDNGFGYLYDVIQTFNGGIYDGESIWMIPYKSDSVIKINKNSGAMTRYNDWPDMVNPDHHAKFRGGVFDGENIWMIPTSLNKVVKINTINGVMTAYDQWPVGVNGSGSDKFSGGVFDGESIWLIPWSSEKVVKINKETGEMTGYNDWPEGFIKGIFSFYGGVYDGKSIWMIPNDADMVVKIDTETGEMTGYDEWPEGFVKQDSAFAGGVYDGQNVWMIPQNADMVVKIGTETGKMTGYDDWPEGFTREDYAFYGGVYDGKSIWMIPSNADRIVKTDKETGEMTGYNDWPAGFTRDTFAFYGGVFDGSDIWMIPRNANKIVKINSYPYVINTTPLRNALNVPLKTNSISIDFNKKVQAGENIALLSIKDSNHNISDYTYQINDNILEVELSTDLEQDMVYTVELPKGTVADAVYSGAKSEAYTFRFTTGNRPYVVNSVPIDKSSGVSRTIGKLEIQYNKPIVPEENLLSLVTVNGNKGTQETVTSYVYKDEKLTLNLEGELDYGTTYTVSLPEGSVLDLVNNDNCIGYMFSFTTTNPISSGSSSKRTKSSQLKHKILGNKNGTPQNIDLKVFNEKERNKINNKVFSIIDEMGLSSIDADMMSLEFKFVNDDTEDDKGMIESFSEPVEISMDLSNKKLTDGQIRKLCAVRYVIDKSGNMSIVKYGGTYDKETQTFKYHTDKPGIYSVITAEEILTLELKIDNIEVLVNSETLNVDVAPIIINSRTMVPIRFIAESFGAKVDWIPELEKVVIEYDGEKLEMIVNKLLEGFDTPPTIMNGRTLVPLRYISEKFGANILWFQENGKVYIVK